MARGEAMNQTPSARIPRHVAIIMDGNGRWAKARGLPRIAGHEKGTESVRAAIRAARDNGVFYLTLYAFSIENWSRPQGEVSALMTMLGKFLRDNEHELHENKIRLRAAGRLEDLPKDLQEQLHDVMKRTEHHERGQLILALSYGGRTEIVQATRRIAEQVKAGTLSTDAIDEKTFAANLYLPDIPDPDLLIRTSGEMRVSNFLLWQISYSEIYVTDVLWPDFREAQFKEAMTAYGLRQRRYGNI